MPGGLTGCGVRFPLASSIPKGGRVSPGKLAGEAGLSGGRFAGGCAGSPAQNRPTQRMQPNRIAIPIMHSIFLHSSIRRQSSPQRMHDLFSADVDNILLIFGADIFQNVRVREKFLRELDAEWLGIHLGIVKGDLDVHVPEITPVIALDHP